MTKSVRYLAAVAVVVFAAPGLAAEPGAKRPNVIIVLSDDQGYGDFSCHGNPLLKTPNLDKLHEQSVRLTDFHVAPMCTPTRSQLLTGMDCLRNGASAVCAGRAFIRPGIPVMPEIFKAGGYKTGLFGKWHLGDSYPNRPNDRGFDEAIYHQGWGITSVADYWCNDYFDGTFRHNGTPTRYRGYCTDVFFNQAMKWMKDRRAKEEPFFCYLPTNVPHGPLWCPAKYKEPYLGQNAPAAFFGMIANLDENMGRLLAFLDEQKLAENTILIFLHDNGGTAGVRFYNAGLRGQKTTYYEGGHKAACFIRWPAGRHQIILQPRDESKLTQVQDLLPTLIDWCGLETPRRARFDGHTLARMLCGGDAYFLGRKIVVQYGESPSGGKLEKYNACVLWHDFKLDPRREYRWRLVHGKELYEVETDPGQKTDLADKHPEVVKVLRDHYEKWWAEVGPLADDYVAVVIGADSENPVALTSADWAGTYCDNVVRDVRGGLPKNGPWHVRVEYEGDYEIALRRWPKEADAAITAGVPAFQAVDGQLPAGKALPVAKARLKIAGFDATKPVAAADRKVTFTVPLKRVLKVPMQTWFYDADGKELCGAYYAYVRRK